MAATFAALRATAPWNPDDPLENGRFAAHIGAMTVEPKFHSKMVKSGRWTVTIATGYGPSSYVGDFATDEEVPIRKTGPILRINQNDPQTAWVSLLHWRALQCPVTTQTGTA